MPNISPASESDQLWRSGDGVAVGLITNKNPAIREKSIW